MKEKYLQTKILKALREAGGWWTKYHVGPRYSQAGVPDILGCYRGLFVALEVKLPNTHSTKLQEQTQKKIRVDGNGIVAVVRSVDEALSVIYAIQRRIKANGERKRQGL